jgi:sugar lactone lactonase YvrE
MRPYAAALFLTPLVLACGGSENRPADDETPVLMPFSVTPAGELTGMRVPESVQYDSVLDVFYVSNIDGNAGERDGKGFIAVVPAESLDVMRVLARGGENGVTLNSPMGLAVTGDTLWVVDIDVVRGINRRTGAPVATVDFSAVQPTMLNDIAVGPNGALYVTDPGVLMAPDGTITHPGESRIYRITNGAVSVVARGEAFGSPNGIAWQDTTGVWLLAPLDREEVLTWVEGDSLPKAPGGYDGILGLRDGRVLVTSWSDGAVHLITHGQMTVLIPNVDSPAALGYDLRRGIIAVPRLNADKIDWFQLKAG